MRELLATLARALVEQPDRVRVSEHPEDEGTRLELEVAPTDRGKVIGKGGRTADALRVVLDAVARRRGLRCRMEILD
ncbi:MAG: KH domain-containing protein [Acidobacteria bacterium]|nr:KH domain-containing protein [Acidobacteriota bacterium]